jgi:hypothetical protein
MVDVSAGFDEGVFDKPSTVLYTDYEDYWADLVTRVDFGCILWASKD